MFVPKPTTILSPKMHDLKNNVNTNGKMFAPNYSNSNNSSINNNNISNKSKYSKKSLKENGYYSNFISCNNSQNSYNSTPFDLEPHEMLHNVQNIHHSSQPSMQHAINYGNTQHPQHTVQTKTRNDFKFLYQVGSGGFGQVWKVQ
jgi:hypothetical protein